MKIRNKTLAQTLMLAAGLTISAAQAWATGVLNISAVVKNPATMTSGATLAITGTCVQGPTPVKIKLVDATSGAVFTPYASIKCGANAATVGKTIEIPTSAVPAGTYKVALKQGTAVAWWQIGSVVQTVVLP
ncbi:hypothetical protein [Novosphingobium sp.]|uniref:hypothetical protein n=1 Tax=Novosphingobium sp. TaxID=1874826 RepID=UPI0025FA1E39|nr:hypothetical protein [Novosphingobium sp.]MCC6926753.1 hypothetical protein [Novosphingobium sp.]